MCIRDRCCIHDHVFACGGGSLIIISENDIFQQVHSKLLRQLTLCMVDFLHSAGCYLFVGRNLGTFKTVALAEFSSKAIDKLLDILDLNIFQI